LNSQSSFYCTHVDALIRELCEHRLRRVFTLTRNCISILSCRGERALQW